MIGSQGFSSQALNNAKTKSEQLSGAGECHARGRQSLMAPVPRSSMNPVHSNL